MYGLYSIPISLFKFLVQLCLIKNISLPCVIVLCFYYYYYYYLVPIPELLVASKILLIHMNG